MATSTALFPLPSSTHGCTSLTLNLREKLAESRATVDDWARTQRVAADQAAADATAQLREEQARVDQASTDLLGVQLHRGLQLNSTTDDTNQSNVDNGNAAKDSVETREEWQQRVVTQRDSNAELEETLAHRTNALQSAQEERRRAKASAVHLQQQQLQPTAQAATVDDLTRGLLNYQALGLDFTKATVESKDIESGPRTAKAMGFTFTQLDPDDPTRKFTFILGVLEGEVADEDQWVVVESSPPLAPMKLDEVVVPLNRNNDMHSFIRAMRKEFKATIQ